MSKISAVTFHFVLKAIARQTSLDASQLLQKAEVDPQIFSQENARISSQKLSEVFHYAMKASGDESLALHIGEAASYQSLGLLGFLLVHTASVGEMLEKFNRYQGLIGNRLRFHFSEEAQYYKIALHIQSNPNIPVPQYHAEAHLSTILNLIRQLSGHQIMADTVSFWHSQPDNLDEYIRIFGPNVRFGAGESAIVLLKSALNLPLDYSNPSMLHYFETEAKKLLQDAEITSCFADVKQLILRQIGEGEVTLETVATQLNVSERVLQKQLQQESHSFREALESVRQQLAKHYLEHTTMDIGAIAIFLGYSESSAFLRAFKRWFGLTPNAYRRHNVISR